MQSSGSATIVDSAWNSLNIDSAGIRRVFRETESEFEKACQILVP
jgi:hypothetical protein